MYTMNPGYSASYQKGRKKSLNYRSKLSGLIYDLRLTQYIYDIQMLFIDKLDSAMNGEIVSWKSVTLFSRCLIWLQLPPPPPCMFQNGNSASLSLNWGRMCKRLRSSGIDSKESIPPACLAWRAGASNRVVVPARQAGNRFQGSLKDLQPQPTTHASYLSSLY